MVLFHTIKNYIDSYHHSSITINKLIYYIGGFNNNTIDTETLHIKVFNLDNYEFNDYCIDNSLILNRIGCNLWSYNGFIYCFGGELVDHSITNQLIRFKFDILPPQVEIVEVFFLLIILG